ncbi:protein of unknown function DUF3689 [Kipferlia bialata]|uniref:Uncharacterized protein n=1 Tax=Kipferlia bialata TaxID=797122 RepID=A0A9K3D0X3_9EUKA|nr:protein of unknown function DUF3689 [Kipferlia bialata]|eukprot:g7297.t1
MLPKLLTPEAFTSVELGALCTLVEGSGNEVFNHFLVRAGFLKYVMAYLDTHDQLTISPSDHVDGRCSPDVGRDLQLYRVLHHLFDRSNLGGFPTSLLYSPTELHYTGRRAPSAKLYDMAGCGTTKDGRGLLSVLADLTTNMVPDNLRSLAFTLRLACARVVDSSVLIRCLGLTFFGLLGTSQQYLTRVSPVMQWFNTHFYFICRLLWTTVTLPDIRQDNVCVVNSALVFLLLAERITDIRTQLNLILDPSIPPLDLPPLCPEADIPRYGHLYI